MKYQVAMLLDVRSKQKPFIIIESYPTSDGIRSRICDGRWATQEQAEAEVTRKLERRAS